MSISVHFFSAKCRNNLDIALILILIGRQQVGSNQGDIITFRVVIMTTILLYFPRPYNNKPTRMR